MGLCVALALSVTCAAVNYDAYYYPLDDGSYGHDTESYEYDVAAEMVAERGFALDVNQFWCIDPNSAELAYIFDFDAFQLAYADLIAQSPIVAPPKDDGEAAADPDVGSAVVEPDEELLVEDPVFDEPVLELPEVIDDGLLDDVVDRHVYTLNDLRDGYSSTDLQNLEGMKSVIRSIFGTYEPVTTTAVYTESVDGEVITSLVDVVAAGSAGVDWEYVSGVALFSMMLFCMFKLLGGIIS